MTVFCPVRPIRRVNITLELFIKMNWTRERETVTQRVFQTSISNILMSDIVNGWRHDYR